MVTTLVIFECEQKHTNTHAVPDNDGSGDAHYSTKFITHEKFEETEHPPKMITKQKY